MNIILEAIHKIRATSSTLGKNVILTSYLTSPAVKNFLRMCYEPHVNFYIQKVDPKLGKPSLMDMDAKTNQQFDEFTLAEVFHTLAKRTLTGNAAKLWLGQLYHSLDAEGQELLTLLIQRDVKAGISTTSINKVWPGLITDVPYMRCCLPKDAKLADWPWAKGIYSQIKADGMFANINHRVDGNVSIESRAGSPFPTAYFKDLIDEIKMNIPEGYQLHGELLMKDANGKIMPREIGNGRFNSLLKEGLLPDGLTPTYQVWDMIPIDQAVVKNKLKVPYKERMTELNYCFQPIKTKFIHIIEYKMAYSLAEAYAHAKEAMTLGLEGTVIKHPEAIWEDTTSKHQVKLKLEFECDLLVTGFKASAEKSKNSDTFGSMLCTTLDDKLRVGVTGIPDDVRKAIWDDRDNWVGKKIITVRANGVMAPSNDTNGYYSLFLPRMIEERLDKSVADTLEQVIAAQAAAIDLLGKI